MKIRRFEIALAIGMLICLLAASAGTQADITQKITRLHIVANSNSPADQALKLQVRDRVLDAVGPDDRAADADLLQLLETTAAETVAEAGQGYPVRAERVWMYFDTRTYDGFALPAGYYDAVRLVIGEGKGRNWWCVMFPPLCNSACEADLEAAALQAGLTGDELAFIRGDGTTYVVRFKIADLIGRIQGFFA